MSVSCEQQYQFFIMPTSLALFRQTHNVKFFLRHFLQAIPLVLKLHVGVFLVEEFPVDIHLLLLDNLVIIRFAGLRGMAAAFGLIADAQGTNAHQGTSHAPCESSRCRVLSHGLPASWSEGRCCRHRLHCRSPCR